MWTVLFFCSWALSDHFYLKNCLRVRSYPLFSMFEIVSQNFYDVKVVLLGITKIHVSQKIIWKKTLTAIVYRSSVKLTKTTSELIKNTAKVGLLFGDLIILFFLCFLCCEIVTHFFLLFLHFFLKIFCTFFQIFCNFYFYLFKLLNK